MLSPSIAEFDEITPVPGPVGTIMSISGNKYCRLDLLGRDLMRLTLGFDYVKVGRNSTRCYIQSGAMRISETFEERPITVVSNCCFLTYLMLFIYVDTMIDNNVIAF